MHAGRGRARVILVVLAIVSGEGQQRSVQCMSVLAAEVPTLVRVGVRRGTLGCKEENGQFLSLLK